MAEKLCGRKNAGRPNYLLGNKNGARRMAKLIKARKKSTSVKQTRIEPITCPHCGGQAYLMRRTLHPKIKGEIWTFECKNCGKQTEKSKLHYTDATE